MTYRLTYQTRSTTVNGLGEVTGDWADEFDIGTKRITQSSAAENVAGGREGNSRTIEVILPYSMNTMDISEDGRLVIDSVNYLIRTINTFGRREVRITAEVQD